MGEHEQTTEARSRRWIPWTVAGGVAVVAAAGAAALVVPGLMRADAAPPPASPPAPTTVTPPAEPTCDSSLDANTPAPFDISSTGDLARIEVDVFDAEPDPDPDRRPWVDIVRVEEGALALVTSVQQDADRLARVTIVEESSSRTRWASTFEGSVQVLASPATTGIDGRLLIAHADGDGTRLVTLDLADGDVVASLATGVHPAPVNLRPAGGGRLPATPSQSAYYVRDSDTVTRLHAETLEPEWTLSGVPFDAERYEGGGFDIVVAGDVLFISGIAFDAETGEELGWSIDGTVEGGGGHALAMPVRYDSYDPFPLSATDLSTGEACWTLEALDVQADGTDLWIVDTNREVQRIDPATGDVLERRGTVPVLSERADAIALFAQAGIVATTTSDMSGTPSPAEAETFVWTPDGAVELPRAPDFVSDGQLVAWVWQTVSEPARVEAYAPADGSLLWAVDTDAELGMAGLTDLRSDEPGRISVAVVR